MYQKMTGTYELFQKHSQPSISSASH